MRHCVPCLFILLLTIPSPAQEIEPSQPVLRIFDIRDLVDDEGEVTDLVREVREVGAAGVEQVVPKDGHVLVVIATKEAHARIQEHLKELRSLRSQVITLEVRFLKLQDATYLGLPEGKSAGRIDAERATGILAEVAKPGGGELTSGPRLTCYPNQEAEIVVGRQISYIRDFEIKRTEGGVVADPIVDTVRDGFALKITPALSVTAGAIDIDLDLTLSEVAKPILTRSQIRVRSQQVPFEIQIPQVTAFRIVRSGTVKDGGWYGIDAGPIPFAGFGGKHLVILVTARRSTLEGLERKK